MAIVLMSVFVFSGGLALAGVEPWLAVIIPFFSPIGLIALFAGVFIEAHINEGRLRAAAGSPDALAKLAAEREARQAKQWQTQIDRLKLEFTIVPGEGIEARFEAAARRPRHGIFSTDSFTGRLVATPGDTSGVDRSRSPDIEDATFGRGFL
jgi:hypothetical protein